MHRWMQEADLQPTDGALNHVAVDETVIQINDEQHWLYAAVESSNGQNPSSTVVSDVYIPVTRKFLTALAEKQDITDVVFLVDDVDDLIGSLRQGGYSYHVQ